MLDVANTIREQLGGARFALMTGAKNFIGLADGLSFKLPGKGFCKSNINYVRITLNELDLYDMEFHRIYGFKVTLISEANNLYADMLEDTFKFHTGLDTRL